jgi:hypothetical protein
MMLLWLACQPFTDSELTTFLRANRRAIDAVQASSEQIETLQTLRHGKGDGDYTYDGTITSSAYQGAIDVTGTGSSSANGSTLAWSFDLSYRDVVVDDIEMNGEVEATISIQITDGSVTVGHVVRGPLDLVGAVDGQADCAYAMTASSTSPASYTGTVSGVDVAPD